MRRVSSVFLVIFLCCPGFLAVAQDAEVGLACGNDRYEDFMRLQYERERADEQRQKAAKEVKVFRAERTRELEQARRTFHRERKADDVQGEKAWLESLRIEKEQKEIARRRYVQRRDELEQSRCRSLKIPELKEYDLENY
jgi:hypothetical protein